MPVTSDLSSAMDLVRDAVEDAGAEAACTLDVCRAVINLTHSVVAALRDAPEQMRAEAYGRLAAAVAELVSDLADAPCLAPRLVQASDVEANDYNPNRVAPPEMDLLETSIRADGVTMPIVVAEGEVAGRYVVVDGFHRREVVAGRLGRRWLPVSVVRPSPAGRMASTVRHNRARGKHGVELMGGLVRALTRAGWDEARIGEGLGMSPEEVLRLRQVVGAAALLASPEYGRAWQGRDGEVFARQADRTDGEGR